MSPLNEQGSLVHAVDDTVGGNVLGRTCQPGKGGEQVGFVDDVTHDLSRLNGTPGHHACAGTRTPPSRKSPLPPRKMVSDMPGTGGRVVRHRPVISHGDHQGVLGDTQFFQLGLEPRHERVDVALQAIL